MLSGSGVSAMSEEESCAGKYSEREESLLRPRNHAMVNLKPMSDRSSERSFSDVRATAAWVSGN